jgi:hypothetical protein
MSWPQSSPHQSLFNRFLFVGTRLLSGRKTTAYYPEINLDELLLYHVHTSNVNLGVNYA